MKNPFRIRIESDKAQDQWYWEVSWRLGSEEYGYADSFKEAQKKISDCLKEGEKPL